MRQKLEKKHPLAIRWFHWINFPVLTLMIWSGLLIYWASDVYGLRIGNFVIVKRFFPDWFYKTFGIVNSDGYGRLAEGMAWHFLFMWVFALNGLLYVLYLAFSGEWRYILPRKGSFKGALQVVLHDLRIRKEPLPREKFNDAQRLAYSGVIFMGLGSLVSGLAIYKPTQTVWLTGLFGGYQNARFVHFWLMMLFCLFYLVHLLQVARAGWNNFRAMVTGYELAPAEEAA